MNDEKKNMCDEDDSKEILEYTGGSELSDLTFQTGYENYSQWRIKEILKEVGFRLEPVYVGYKALRYRPCQRYWVVNILTEERVGNSYNGFSLEDLIYALARCGYSLHSQYYNPTRDKDGMVILHIGRSKVYELLRENTIPNLRIGKKYIIPKQLLIDFLINNQANT